MCSTGWQFLNTCGNFLGDLTSGQFPQTSSVSQKMTVSFAVRWVKSSTELTSSYVLTKRIPNLVWGGDVHGLLSVAAQGAVRSCWPTIAAFFLLLWNALLYFYQSFALVTGTLADVSTTPAFLRMTSTSSTFLHPSTLYFSPLSNTQNGRMGNSQQTSMYRLLGLRALKGRGIPRLERLQPPSGTAPASGLPHSQASVSMLTA